jgi:endonuclease/exonuclease/phosphatase family metal-dependent hydrolase
MTYNIWNGGRDREQAICQVIQAANPDVVIVQEITNPMVLERIADTLGMDYYLTPKPDWWHKVGLLSRLPVLAWCTFPAGWGWRHCLEATLQLPNQQQLTVYGIHLLPYFPFFFEGWRRLDLQLLIRQIQQTTEEAHILAGDFNATTGHHHHNLNNQPRHFGANMWSQLRRIWGHSVKPLATAGYVDCFRTFQPHEAGFTLPATRPAVRLDYIFASPALATRLKSCHVVLEPEAVRVASDHLPVIAEFHY